MSTRKERSLRNQRAHAAERTAVLGRAPVDPLEKPPLQVRMPLVPIPWNKIRLGDEARRAIQQALMKGYPRNEIAKALGTTVSTLRRIVREDHLLADAVEVRKDKEEAELRELLVAMARRGDTVAAIFLAKAQFGWRDRDDSKLKVEGASGGVLVVPAVGSLEDWEAAAYSQQAQFRKKVTGEANL